MAGRGTTEHTITGRRFTGRRTTGRLLTGRRTTGRLITGRRTTGRLITGRRTTGRLITGRRTTGRRITGRRLLAGGLGLLALTTIALLVRRRVVLSRLARHREAGLPDRRGLDALTGLPNRAEGIWWLNTRLARAQARGHRLALMVLDLDGFAEVNAVHGRAVGDHVLQVTAARMQAQLRTGDMVCRAGNDTFMVIMDAAGPDHLVAQVCARVVAAVGEPITYHSDGIQVTASMGFAVSQDRDRNADLLLDRADRALIQAKSSARNIVQF